MLCHVILGKVLQGFLMLFDEFYLPDIPPKVRGAHEHMPL